MFQPLAGLKVIDLTQVLAGPYAAYQLALMGAEVIKIETPGSGDWTRTSGALPELNARRMGIGYLTQNANKKSVALNIKTEEGMEILKKLVAEADVFIENFRPGTIARLGLPFEVAKEINPKILYCSISAYGQDGPFSARPAYDHVIQGMCGIMKTTGTLETGPQKVGAPYVDYATGLNAAFAIVSALHQTRATGEALHVDVAMLDTSIMLMASLMTSHLTGGWTPAPSGNEAWSASPSSGAFETRDGLLMIAANNDKQFRAMCKGLGREDILADPRWAEPKTRAQNAPALRAELVAIFLTDTAAHWETVLDLAGVPAARVRRLDETLAEEQAKVRQLALTMQWNGGGPSEIHLPTLGFKVNGETPGPTVAPPELGADTGEVLRRLGYGEEELRRLAAQSVI